MSRWSWSGWAGFPPSLLCKQGSYVPAEWPKSTPDTSLGSNATVTLRINHGLGFCKYTGSRGKGGASDASAEVVGYVRRTMDAAGVIWQMSELGKVDAGGGGTVLLVENIHDGQLYPLRALILLEGTGPYQQIELLAG